LEKNGIKKRDKTDPANQT